jgi:ribonuclease BN (tRNA processing enzyme)
MINTRNFYQYSVYILLFYTIVNFTPVKAFCGDKPLAIQILGSGGPIADGNRAASGYLLWINGKSRLMVDAGGGVFLRFGEAKARIEDLNLLAISHFHTDHVADVPAILKGGFFSSRQRPLKISGPSGNHFFPDTQSFFKALFKEKTGAFYYLSGFLQGNDGLFKLDLSTVDVKKPLPQ